MPDSLLVSEPPLAIVEPDLSSRSTVSQIRPENGFAVYFVPHDHAMTLVDPTLVDPTLVDPTLVDPTLADPTRVHLFAAGMYRSPASCWRGRTP